MAKNKSWDDNFRLLFTNKRFLILVGGIFVVWSFKEGWWDIPLLRDGVTEVIRFLGAIGE